MKKCLSYPATPRVKICGITSVEDGLLAVNAGADAIGMVFYEPSPRDVDINHAALIAQAVGPFVTVVALFVNASKDSIQHILNTVNIHVIQFHGDETSEFCEQFNRPYIKALRMKPELDIIKAIQAYPSAAGILLDAYREGVPGGTGDTFDWQRVPKQTDSMPIILAGGLTPQNVADAIKQTHVYGVDVSGGVEKLKGKKDEQKTIDFIKRSKIHNE